MKAAARNNWLHFLLLLLWIVLGLILRLTNLTAKPLWTDEFSTVVFSLGNSFRSVPLDQIISSATLLEPLKPTSSPGVEDVIRNLFRESNHPPLYFLLTHFWLKLFPLTANGLVSAWSVRSLAAFWGVAAIPGSFMLGWLAFRSRLTAQIAAALMAVSPFGIYLSQEARHYTLPILWILISLCCLVIAARRLRDREQVSWSVGIIWIIVNALGVATHYFFILTLGAEAIVIASLGLVQSWQERGIWYPSSHWRRIWLIAAGTLITSLIWLPELQDIQGGDLTSWIHQPERTGWAWLEPLGQAAAGWITMLYLLPIQAEEQAVVWLSGAVLIFLVLWTVPKLYRGLRVQYLERDSRLGVMVLGVFVAGAIFLFFIVTYFFETNLTSAFRYNFVYFPAVVALIGAGLASGWNVATRIAQTEPVHVPNSLLGLLRISNRKTVILIWLLSLLGAITVLSNLGYQKTHRPDLVADAIRQDAQNPVLIAIPHQTHGQTGRLMGIALELQDAPENTAPRFLLARTTQDSRSVVSTLRRAMNQIARPLDLWLINFESVPEGQLENLLEQQRCTAETRFRSVDGYRYRLYRCTQRLPQTPSSPLEET